MTRQASAPLNSPFRSLHHFLSTFLLVVIFPSLLFGLVAAWQMARQFVEEREQDAGRLAAVAAEGMVNHIGGMTASLAVLSRLPLGPADHSFFYRVARGFSQQAGYHVTLGDGEGQQFLSTRQPFGVPLPRRSDLDSIKRALASGEPHVSDLFASSMARRIYLVTVDAPVATPEGMRILTLSSDVESLAEVLFRAKVPPGWLLGMIDGQGRFIARSRDPEKWVGQPVGTELLEATRKFPQGQVYNASVDGFQILTVFHRIPGTDWSVLVGVPVSVLHASLAQPLGLLAASIAAVIALTALLAFLFIRQLNGATRRLMAVAHAPLEPRNEPPAANSIAEFEAVSQVIRNGAAKREQLATALDTSATIIRNLDGTIRHWTKGCEALFGWKREEVVGRNIHELLDTEFPASRESIEAVLLEKGAWAGELIHSLKDQQSVRVSAHWILHSLEPGRTVVVETVHDLSAETRLELALGESEARFRATFEQAAVGVAHVARDGRWLRVNRRFCEIVGHAREDLLQMTYLDITHPEDKAASKELGARIWSNRIRNCRIEKRYLCRDGGFIWVNVTVSLARTAAGLADYCIAVVEDIQLRKAAEFALAAERETFRQLTRMSSDYFWECDGEARFTAISEPSCAISDHDYQQYIGKALWEMPHAGVRDQTWESHRACLAAHLPFRHFEMGLVTDGEERWLSLSGYPVFAENGEFKGYRGVAQDITERRASQQLLERQVAERTAELVAANKELEGFTYAASHDLRAPLGRINSFSTLLEKQYRERLEGDGLLFLDMIRRNTVRLIALVDDLLVHAQIERKIMDSQPVDLPAVVQAILVERGDEIRELGAEIRLSLAPVLVLANPHGLAQVLRNLMENALKYSRGSTPPVIEVGARLQAGWCRLWVRDNGIGFDMAYQERIFEIFRRLHTYEEFPGSGIGLALVKKAMDRMGGRVWGEGVPGQGATFYIELKWAGAAAGAVISPAVAGGEVLPV